jgi:hypothetical protein
MASATPEWPDTLNPIFRKIYGEELKQKPTMYSNIFHVMSSTKIDEKDSSASGLTKLVIKDEGAPLAEEDPLQGYDVTYTHVERGLISKVTNKMWREDQHNVMNKRPRDLARAKVRTREYVAADIFNYGFTAGGGGDAPFTGGDAKALFATDHPRTDGGAAQSNMITDDLNEDSFEIASVSMGQSLDDKGQLFEVMPTHLLHPPTLAKEVKILLKSSGRIGTANNDINPYQEEVTPIMWAYLGAVVGGSDTAWFLLAMEDHMLNWFNREDRGLEGPDWDFRTKTAQWSVDETYSCGFSGWHGTFGSKGDNS